MASIAIAMGCLAAFLLTQTRLDSFVELPLAAALATYSALELRAYRRHLSGVTRLRVYVNGDVRVLRSGQWHLGQLASGSVFLRRAAWVRVVGAGHARVDCLCREPSTGIEPWRRFRLVIRHIGAIN